MSCGGFDKVFLLFIAKFVSCVVDIDFQDITRMDLVIIDVPLTEVFVVGYEVLYVPFEIILSDHHDGTPEAWNGDKKYGKSHPCPGPLRGYRI